MTPKETIVENSPERNINTREIPSDADSLSCLSSPPEKLTCQVVIATLLSTFGCVNFGYALGWTNQSLTNIQKDGEISELSSSQQSLISSILTIGAIIGTIFGADISDRYGRQLCLILTAIAANVGWICVSLAKNYEILVVGRCVIGVSIGMVNTASPAFIAEITPPAYRGITGGAFQNGVNSGIFLSYLVSPYLEWRVLSAIGLCFGSVMGFGLMFMKESPVWLLSNNKILKYEQSAAFYSGLPHAEYINYATSETSSEGGGTMTRLWTLMKNPQMYKPLLLCMFMSLAFQFSAATIISFYNITMFTNAGVSNSKAMLGSQCLGAAQLVVGIAGSILSTKWPRKPHFLITSYLTSLGLCSIAVCYLVKDKFYDDSIMDYAVIAAFIFTISIFAFGAGTITWSYVGELLPADGTGLVVGTASFINWFSSFFLTFYYSTMQVSLNDYGVFFVYAGLHFVCTCLLVWLPETRGMSLAEIQSNFIHRRSIRAKSHPEVYLHFVDEEGLSDDQLSDRFVRS